MDTMKKIQNTETALSLFEEAATKHAEATENGIIKSQIRTMALSLGL
jgi:hypothetical protein